MNNSYLNNLEYEPVKRISDRRRIKLIALLVLFIVITLTLIFASKIVNAKRPGNRIKQIISVEIQRGDTLWSIASSYMSDEYEDLSEYIDEIMISNGLTSDMIHAGKYIIVPYYADAS